MKYQKHYGSFGGAPDFTRCAASVLDRHGGSSHQCLRKATHDPEDAYGGRFTTCSTHSRAAEARRKAKADERFDAYKARFDAKRDKVRGHNMAEALLREIVADAVGAGPFAISNSAIDRAKEALALIDAGKAE